MVQAAQASIKTVRTKGAAGVLWRQDGAAVVSHYGPTGILRPLRGCAQQESEAVFSIVSMGMGREHPLSSIRSVWVRV